MHLVNNRRLQYFRCAIACGCIWLGTQGANASPTTPVSAKLSQFASQPLYFEANQGQGDPRAAFVTRTPGGNFLFSATEMAVILNQTGSEGGPAREHVSKIRTRSMVVRFGNANPEARIVGGEQLRTRINYLLGNDPSQWRTEVPAYAKLQVQGLYPGIDLIYHGNQQNLEYDLVVAPGADPGAISLRVQGADEMRIDAQGELVLKLGSESVRQHKPVIYQSIGGVRQEVAGGYRLTDRKTVWFEIGSYDRAAALVIDPVLSFSTYFGGTGSDTGWDIALDTAGNIYIAGETRSANLPTTTNVFQPLYKGGFPSGFGDAFVAKLDNTGANLLYVTYLGGTGDDGALGLAVDSQGSAYLSGFTDSTNFPLQNPIVNHISGSATNGVLYPYDAFVTKLSATGGSLVYSTYLGGNGQDQAIGIAVDSTGSAYATGYTESTNFPVTNALAGGGALNARADVFVAKLLPNGTDFAYSTFIGGSGIDHGEGIAVDSAGTAFITGYTTSTNFPMVLAATNNPVITNSFQGFLAGGRDVFLTKINAAGTVAESTYVGGLGDDIGFRVAVDNGGNAYVTGSQTATGFPITPGKLNPGGLFKSTDAAGNWAGANTGLYYNAVSSLALDAATPSTAYAGNWRGISRTTDSGASWQPILQMASDVRALALDPSNPAILYGANNNIIFRLVFNGTDWLKTQTNLSATVNNLLVDASSPSTIYAATDAGIFKSTNSATNWLGSDVGIPAATMLVLAAVPGAPGTLYAGTSIGVYRSTNHAANWQALNNGLTNLVIEALAIDPVTPSTLYAGTLAGLYKSSNSGTNWSITGLGASNFITAVAVDPSAPSTVYAGTTSGLFKSVNGGINFVQATNGMGRLTISVLAVNPLSPATIYAGTRGVAAFGGVDAFIMKFDASGSNQYSMVFGGLALDQGWDVAVDPAGNAFVIGATASKNFPMNNPPSSSNTTNQGLNDAFVTAINADASAFLYSTYLGGSREDFGLGIEVDSGGNAYVVGETSSTNFPTRQAIYGSFRGTNDTFIAKISSDPPTLTAAQVGNNLQLSWPAFPPGFSLESTANPAAQALWTPVAATPAAVNGWHTVTVGLGTNQSFFRLRR